MNECSKGARQNSAAHLIRQTDLGIALLPSFLRGRAWAQLITVTTNGSESQVGTETDVREREREKGKERDGEDQRK